MQITASETCDPMELVNNGTCKLVNLDLEP